MKNYTSKLTLLLFFTFVSGSFQITSGQETLNKEDQTTATTSNEDGIEYECVPCEVKYKRGPTIIGGLPFPPKKSIFLPTGGTVNLYTQFADPDKRKYKGSGCPLDENGQAITGWVPIECIGGHEAVFKITELQNKASFNPTDSNIDQLTQDASFFKVKKYRQDIYKDIYDYSSEQTILYTSSNWTSGNIEVSVDILDNTPLPIPSDTTFEVNGSCQDPSLTNYQIWTIKHSNNVPLELKTKEGNPADNTWIDMFDFDDFVVPYSYLGVDSCENTGDGFPSHIVTEFFSSTEPLFELSDLRQSWLDEKQIMTLDQAVEELFVRNLMPAQNVSFVLDSESEFADEHGRFEWNYIDDPETTLEQMLIFTVFKLGSLEADKIGYVVNQEYRTANEISLGTTEIKRALRPFNPPSSQVSWYINKNHTDICSQ